METGNCGYFAVPFVLQKFSPYCVSVLHCSAVSLRQAPRFQTDREATVYTAHPVWIRKMDKLCKEFLEVIRLKSWTEVSKTYVLPKNLIRIAKPRILSEAQLRHLQELQKKI